MSLGDDFSGSGSGMCADHLCVRGRSPVFGPKTDSPNSTPMALKTKESKDPGTRFSLPSSYWFCYSRLYCWDDNGDAKSNFGIWVRKFGIGQGMFQKNREKWEKVSLNVAKRKKETFWVNGHFNSSGIRHENRWKRNFVSVYYYVL